MTKFEREYYKKVPWAWISDRLGVELETLDWSLIPEYTEQGYFDENGTPVPEKWDGTPNPIVEILKAFRTHQHIAVESGTGLGKAEWVENNIQTPLGPKRMGDITVGDYVIGSNGKPTKVLAVYPQGVREMYNVLFSDGAQVIVDGDHLWNVRTRKDKYRGKEYKTLTTKEIQKEIKTKDLFIPMTQPVEYEEKKFIIDPYVLGVLLGDGGFTLPTVILSTNDEFILEEFERLLPAINVKYRSQYDYGLVTDRGQSNYVGDEIKRLGLFGHRSEDKFIPTEYLYGSIEQRIALLQGLMDSDGTIASGNSFIFSTVSGRLAKDIINLAESLGGNGKLKIKQGKYKNKKHFSLRVSIKLPNSINPFRLPRKAERVTDRTYGVPRRRIISVESVFEAEAKCIRVEAEDSLYLTENYIVTHNTFLAACAVLYFLDVYGDPTDKTKKGNPKKVDCRVVTLAPNEQQLKKLLWKEIHGMWPNFKKIHPQAEIIETEIKMHPKHKKWFATGITVGVGAEETAAIKAQGHHAPNMLIVTDETPGIVMPVMTAIQNTITDGNVILSIGNPDNIDDTLHQVAVLETTKHVIMSAWDYPNVVANRMIISGATDKKSIAMKLAMYKSETDPMYMSRVRGICPDVGAACLFRQDALVSAQKMLAEPIETIEIPFRNEETGERRWNWSEGVVKIYREVEHTHLNRYIVFADVAGDGGKGDYHAGIVYDRILERVVATVHMLGPREDYIGVLLEMCERYKVRWNRLGSFFYPLFAWETTGGAGSFILDERIKIYPMIYYDRNIEVEGANLRAMAGWDTGKRNNRKQMVSALDEFGLTLIARPYRVVDKRLHDEMRTFVSTKKGKGTRYEAAKGKNDDMVMALGAALVIDKIIPLPEEQKKEPEIIRQNSHFEQLVKRNRLKESWSDDGAWSNIKLSDVF